MSVLAVTRTADEVFLLVFGGIAVIIVTARLVGRLFGAIGLPNVVGEIVGGLLLGPSALGLVPGDPSALLFPPDIQPFLRIIASFGLVIYMFIIGLELDPRTVRAERRAAISISLASIVTPFLLGALVGLIVFADHDTATTEVSGMAVPVDVDRLAFVLFCGLAICGSAFAILARILDERRLFGTRMGGVLLASTVVDDIVVWMLASVVLAIAAAGGLSEVPLVMAGLVAFVIVLFGAVRPALRRLMAERFRRNGGLSSDLFAVILVGLLASALYTTWLGISPILGAFFFGAAVPRDGTARLFAQLNERLESVSVLVLLPVFFAVTGLGVDLSGLGLDGLLLLVVFVVIATVGKMAGAALGASFNGLRGRRALAVGVLMNTRGLSELALISIGRSLGVLDATMFTVLVCTAIATTLLSGPLLQLVYPQHLIDADIAAAERSRLAETSPYRLLVVLDDVTPTAPMLDVAVDLTRSEPGSEVVIARFASGGPTTELGSGFMGDLSRATAALDELRLLSRRATEAGVSAVPKSRITDDVDREILAEVDLVRPHLVLVSGETVDRSPAIVERLTRERHVDVGTVFGTPAPRGPVAILGPLTTVHRTAVIEVGLRAAQGRTGGIVSRERSVVEAAETMGIPIGRPSAEPVAVEITGPGAPPDDERAVIQISAHDPGTGPRRLDEMIARLRTGPSPEGT